MRFAVVAATLSACSEPALRCSGRYCGDGGGPPLADASVDASIPGDASVPRDASVPGDASVPRDAGLSWSEPETIASTGNVGHFPSIRVDAAGTQHVVYSYYGGAFDRASYYARRAVGAMTWTTSDPEGSGATDRWPSFVLDVSGAPHVVYSDDDKRRLRYARGMPGGTTWSPRTEDVYGASAGVAPSLGIDSKGTLHAAFEFTALGDLAYATRTSGAASWTIAGVGPGIDGGFPSLVVDSADGIHITFQDAGVGRLMYAYRAPIGTTWTVTPIDTVGVPMHSSLAIGSDGALHVAYWRRGSGDLVYARRAPGATTWTVAEIDTAGNVGAWPSIGVDSTGAVHIAYSDVIASALRYATNASGTWRAIELDADGSAGGDDEGSPRSLAIDSLDHIHVVYFDATHADLRLRVLR